MSKLHRKNKNMNFIRKVWKLLSPFHRRLYGIFIVTTLFETVRMGGPFLFGKILDLLIATKGFLTVETGLAVIGGLVGVRLFSLFVDYTTDRLIVGLLWRSEHYVSTVSFNKLLELSLDYHEKVSTGKKISLVNRGKDKLMNLLEAFTWEFQPIVLQLVITSVFMVFVSPKIAIIFVLSLIPFVIITVKTFQATKALRNRRHDLYEKSSSEIGDTITNIPVVKAFAQEGREEKSFQSLWSLVQGIEAKEFRKHMYSNLGKSLAVEFFYALLLIVAVFEVRSQVITVGSLVFLISLVERAYSHVYRLGRIYERAVDASEPVDRITELMQKSALIKNSPSAVRLPEFEGQIRFRNVTFAYHKRKVLKNVSFTIPAGSFTALVGRSGSGKSTIAKLLSRYYDPSQGSIVIDGKYDLRDLDLDTYRRHTAVVFQDSPVPNRRVWEVISYAAGKKNFSSVYEKVVDAAKLAYAHEFILELKDGYLTEIGERGVKLSGGQRQRIAIARALFAEPKILIMDEPTSHLDALSENLIQKALDDLSKEHSFTKIIIAHRLSTVQRAGQILVMERGVLVERGTHAELVKKGGVYAQIVRQSELKR